MQDRQVLQIKYETCIYTQDSSPTPNAPCIPYLIFQRPPVPAAPSGFHLNYFIIVMAFMFPLPTLGATDFLSRGTLMTWPRTSRRRRAGTSRVVPRSGPSRPPPFQDATPDSSSDFSHDLHWKDRVALYAQFSAEETLHAILMALQTNNRTGPHKDDGIDALYAFANLDIWALSHRFFGKKMDLGQFERFKRVVVAHPYDILLRNYESRTLSAIHVKPDVYVTRRTFKCGTDEKFFTFTMSRADFGGDRAWMVDSIIYDEHPIQ